VAQHASERCTDSGSGNFSSVNTTQLTYILKLFSEILKYLISKERLINVYRSSLLGLKVNVERLNQT